MTWILILAPPWYETPASPTFLALLGNAALVVLLLGVPLPLVDLDGDDDERFRRERHARGARYPPPSPPT